MTVRLQEHIVGVPYKDVTILVVEDQRPFLVLLKGLLTNLGAKDVLMATHADQALKYCRHHTVDVVVCDLHLGSNKKNGYELYQELIHRKLLSPLSVFLLISADAARPVVLGSLEHNPDDYLLKPFSLAQVKSRLNKAWKKKQFFKAVYQAHADGNVSEALSQINQLAVPTLYQRDALQIKVELCWHQKQFDAAISLLRAETSLLSSQWTQLALAKSYLFKREFQLAIKCASQVLSLNRHDPDAHDIIAQAKTALDCPDEALASMRQAIKSSPYSLARQQLACNIAQQCKDFSLLVDASLATWTLSKHTVFKRISHWCNHIGFLLDAAEAADNKIQRHRYQQEALLQVQRGKHDEAILRLDEPFDIDIFTSIVTARVDAIDGKLIDAKNAIITSQINIENRFDDYPVTLAPSSIQTLLDLGEFEEAQQILNRIDKDHVSLDQNTLRLISQFTDEVKEGENQYAEMNRRGIQLYQQNKYEEAKQSFSAALSLSPVNTSIALNLLQCQVKLFNQGDKLDPLLVKEARQVYKIVNNTPLREQYQSKFENLRDELIRLNVTTR